MRELLLGSALAGGRSKKRLGLWLRRSALDTARELGLGPWHSAHAPAAPAPRLASPRLCVEGPRTAHPGGSGGTSIAPARPQGCCNPDPTQACAGPQNGFIPRRLRAAVLGPAQGGPT